MHHQPLFDVGKLAAERLSSMEGKMLQCQGCEQIDYCSESCQKQDWKAFHKHECSKLVGKTKNEIHLKETKQADLQKHGGIFPTLDLPLCR